MIGWARGTRARFCPLLILPQSVWVRQVMTDIVAEM